MKEALKALDNAEQNKDGGNESNKSSKSNSG